LIFFAITCSAKIGAIDIEKRPHWANAGNKIIKNPAD
jgi:hypothetical protein